MRETTWYGKSCITCVSCKIQSTVHTVLCLLRPSWQLGLPVITLRSDSSVTLQYWKSELSWVVYNYGCWTTWSTSDVIIEYLFSDGKNQYLNLHFPTFWFCPSLNRIRSLTSTVRSALGADFRTFGSGYYPWVASRTGEGLPNPSSTPVLSPMLRPKVGNRTHVGRLLGLPFCFRYSLATFGLFSDAPIDCFT